jgi:hypothetical protein
VREIFEQVRKAPCVEINIVAMSITLMIQDIARALDFEGGIASGWEYKNWFDNWMGISCHFIDCETCYQFRCSLLHQGQYNHRTQHTKDSYSFIWRSKTCKCIALC